MNASKYDTQRSQGAEQIVSHVKELAGESGITLSECLWDSGQQMVDRDNHALEIRAEGKSAKGQFSDEQLADYPGRVGTERTDAILREMVRSLKK